MECTCVACHPKESFCFGTAVGAGTHTLKQEKGSELNCPELFYSIYCSFKSDKGTLSFVTG